MFSRIAIACFALYCVHGAQNSTREVASLAGEGAALAREAASAAPQAALRLCLDNAALCARAAQAGAGLASAPAPAAQPTLKVVDYPLPPQRPAAHKKA